MFIDGIFNKIIVKIIFISDAIDDEIQGAYNFPVAIRSELKVCISGKNTTDKDAIFSICTVVILSYKLNLGYKTPTTSFEKTNNSPPKIRAKTKVK